MTSSSVHDTNLNKCGFNVNKDDNTKAFLGEDFSVLSPLVVEIYRARMLAYFSPVEGYQFNLKSPWDIPTIDKD